MNEKSTGRQAGRGAGAVLVVLAGLATGCAPARQIDYDRAPVPYVLCVARPAVLEAAEAPATERVVPLDMEALARYLVQELHDLRVCTRVEEVRTADAREALAEARRLGADLLMTIEAESWPRYRLAGRTGWYIPNIGLWFLVGLPSWWVRDCIYEVSWAADFSLYSVSGGRVLSQGVRSMRAEAALSVAERGWTWRALLTPPAYYEGPDEGTALEFLAEDVLVDQVLELIGELPLGVEAVSIDIAPVRSVAPAEGDVAGQGTAGELRRLPLRITVRSERELERFAVELDGQRVSRLDHNRLTLPGPVRSADPRRVFEYSFLLSERDLAGIERRDEHYLRVMARGVGASSRPDSWSTSRTLRLVRDREGLATATD